MTDPHLGDLMRLHLLGISEIFLSLTQQRTARPRPNLGASRCLRMPRHDAYQQQSAQRHPASGIEQAPCRATFHMTRLSFSSFDCSQRAT